MIDMYYMNYMCIYIYIELLISYILLNLSSVVHHTPLGSKESLHRWRSLDAVWGTLSEKVSRHRVGYAVQKTSKSISLRGTRHQPLKLDFFNWFLFRKYSEYFLDSSWFLRFVKSLCSATRLGPFGRWQKHWGLTEERIGQSYGKEEKGREEKKTKKN